MGEVSYAPAFTLEVDEWYGWGMGVGKGREKIDLNHLSCRLVFFAPVLALEADIGKGKGREHMPDNLCGAFARICMTERIRRFLSYTLKKKMVLFL